MKAPFRKRKGARSFRSSPRSLYDCVARERIMMNLDHSADPARNRNASFALRFAFYLKRRWIQCVVLGVVGFVVRMPALQGQLVWDDEYLAHLNPFIKSPLLIFEAFRHYLFLDSFSAHYRPVQNLSFIFDYYFWNAETYGFHFTNLLLHVASGLFLFCLLARLLPTLTHTRKNKEKESSSCDTSLVAFLVALLWIVHPVHSAAVDYISGRADSLAFIVRLRRLAARSESARNAPKVRKRLSLLRRGQLCFARPLLPRNSLHLAPALPAPSVLL